MRRLTCAALAAAALLLLPAAASAAPTAIGIGEQSPSIFQDPSWQRLNSRDVRYIVAWDALRVPWQKAEVDDVPGQGARQRARASCSASAARARRSKSRRKYLPSPSPPAARVPRLPRALPVGHRPT